MKFSAVVPEGMWNALSPLFSVTEGLHKEDSGPAGDSPCLRRHDWNDFSL